MPDSFFPTTGMPDPDWWQALWPDPGKVLEALGVQRGIVAVDLCCGDGHFTAPLARMARKVYAIDIDPQMLGRAKALVAKAGATNCDFIEADAMDVAAVVPGAVEFVLLANTFHGVPDPRRLARAVAAILKPGGTFAIVNWHQRPREETVVLGQPRGPQTGMRMSPEAVRAVVEPAGLRPVLTVELPPYHYGAVFGKPGAQGTESAAP
jgi:SAM-dependent methyltransferase